MRARPLEHGRRLPPRMSLPGSGWPTMASASAAHSIIASRSMPVSMPSSSQRKTQLLGARRCRPRPSCPANGQPPRPAHVESNRSTPSSQRGVARWRRPRPRVSWRWSPRPRSGPARPHRADHPLDRRRIGEAHGVGQEHRVERRRRTRRRGRGSRRRGHRRRRPARRPGSCSRTPSSRSPTWWARRPLGTGPATPLLGVGLGVVHAGVVDGELLGGGHPDGADDVERRRMARSRPRLFSHRPV